MTIFQLKLTDHAFRRIATIRGARHADAACIPARNAPRAFEPKRSGYRWGDRPGIAE
jgi:hypothetical protein